MLREIMFRLTLGIYYLALGVWLGATAMMGASAGLTFVTLRAAEPVLPEGPAGNAALSPHTADFLAGNVVNAAFGALTILQIACLLIIVALIALQATIWRDRLVRGGRTWINGLRIGMVALALAVFAFDLLVTRGSMGMLREKLYREDVTLNQYEAMQVDFQRLHQLSARAQLTGAGLMAGTALLSPFVLVGRAGAWWEGHGHG